VTWLGGKIRETYAAWLCGGGFAAFHQGRFEEAIRILERARSYDPTLGHNDEVARCLIEARKWLTSRRESSRDTTASTPDIRPLTAFQKKTEVALRAALEAAGSALVSRSLKTAASINAFGPRYRETYVRATVQGINADVFIYEDSATLGGPDTDMRFEAPDYENGDALAAALISATVRLVVAGGPKSN